jgi:Zn-dependent metalloprotease
MTPGFMNAFWDPRTAEWYFGDGDGAIFDDSTESLDIVAHEYLHAVTQFAANLPYQWQSGPLNEHFSDVFGSLIKQYQLREKAGDADWLVGEGIFLSEKAPALRSMKAPGSAYDWPKVIGKDPQPADMEGYHELPMSADNGGVHIYSGIPNHAFYLVAVAFGGHAWEKAGKIWYDTLVDPGFEAVFDPQKVNAHSLEVNSKNAFKLMADLTCRHAKRLYGQDGFNVVRNAWMAMKVLPTRALL